MTHKTVKDIEYDWIKIPIGTDVTIAEGWREHEKYEKIAVFTLPNGQICPLFYDEVIEHADNIQ